MSALLKRLKERERNAELRLVKIQYAIEDEEQRLEEEAGKK